jgi:pilus assembly protein TadC
MALIGALVAAVLVSGLSPRFVLRWRGLQQEAWSLDQVARLMLVAVSSGMPLATALRATSNAMSGPVARQMDAVARRALLVGTGRALIDAPPELQPLAAMLARAQVSGASVAGALEAFLEARRRAAVFEAVARARRLGIALVIPLTLLLLPGFGLVLFGPYVAEHLGGFLSIR